MRIAIEHRTRYHWSAPLEKGLQQIRLTPESGPGQQVLDWETRVEGGRVETTWRNEHDCIVKLLSIDPGTTEVVITSAGTVETHDRAGVYGAHQGQAPLWLYRRETPLTATARGIRALAREVGAQGLDPVSELHALSAAILSRIPYRSGDTGAATTAEEALAGGSGVCQDHTHVFCAAARVLGYPARYVSGYLRMGDRTEQEATHAWSEAHVPGLGWIGLDVSNAISPDEDYVRIGCGLDYAGAAPVSGLTQGSANEALVVSLQVQQ